MRRVAACVAPRGRAGGGRWRSFPCPLDDLVCVVAVLVVSLVDMAASASAASGLRIEGPSNASR
jgi:hypothetical protein